MLLGVVVVLGVVSYCEAASEKTLGATLDPDVYVTELDEESNGPVVAIGKASKAFSEAYVRNDVDTIKALYTEDALLLPPGREVRGREAAGELFRWGPQHRQISHAMTSSDLTVRGDVAIDAGTWHSTVQRGGGALSTSSGRYLVVWIRGNDGQWRMQYDMWHRPAPAPAKEAPRVEE